MKYQNLVEPYPYSKIQFFYDSACFILYLIILSFCKNHSYKINTAYFLIKTKSCSRITVVSCFHISSVGSCSRIQEVF